MDAVQDLCVEKLDTAFGCGDGQQWQEDLERCVAPAEEEEPVSRNAASSHRIPQGHLPLGWPHRMDGCE